MATIKIEIPTDSIAITIQGTTIPVNMTRMPNNALVAYLLKGVKRMHNDACSAGGDLPSEKIAYAESHIDKFYDGVVSAPKGSTPGLSLLATEMAKAAMPQFKAAYGEEFKVDFHGVTTRKRHDAVLEWLNESDQDKFRDRVEVNAQSTIDLDLPEVDADDV